MSESTPDPTPPAQPPPAPPAPPPAPSRAAPPIRLGISWYPELWPDDQWAADIAKMKEAGVNCVRLFEYAWHRFEPREWEYDFYWATNLLDQLRDAGIGVICCTPTAAPPAWLLAKYPEVLRTGPDARRAVHGLARPGSMVSTRYREFCARIVDQMVHSFRGHEAVVGWQIDTRIDGADYGAEARRAFHGWLSERFGYAEQMNSAWGLEYRSQAYENVDQVPLPTFPLGGGNVTVPPERRHHPSLFINFQRFINDQWAMYIQAQVETLRGGFETPLSTNMPPGWGVNWFRQNHLLDRAGIALPREAASLAEMLWPIDRLRAEKPGVPFWVLEAGLEGPGGGALRHDPRATTALMWLAALNGADVIVGPNWRQHHAGQDMRRPALLSPAGTPTPQHAAWRSATKQIAEQGAWLSDHTTVEARVAVVVSNESAWAFAIDPPEPGNPAATYEALWRDEFYLPLARAHYWRDVIDQTQDYCPYHVMIVPLVPLMHHMTITRLKDWVEGGGCLLLGPTTGTHNEEYTAPTSRDLGMLADLIGGTSVARFDVIGIEDQVSVKFVVEPDPTGNGSEGNQSPATAGDGEGAAASGAAASAGGGSGASPDATAGYGESPGDPARGGISADVAPSPAAAPPSSDDVVSSPAAAPPSAAGSSAGPAADPAAAIPRTAIRGLCEGFTPTTGKVLARYDGGPAHGTAAVLVHKLGQGTVLTVGCRVDESTYLDLVWMLCETAKVKPLAEGGPGIAVVPRMRPDNTIAGYGLVNLTPTEQTVTLPAGGTDRLTARDLGPSITLAPLEVMLLETQRVAAPETTGPGRVALAIPPEPAAEDVARATSP